MNNPTPLGLTSDWIENNTVKRFVLTTVSDSAVNVWAEESLAILESHPDDHPYLIIHDLSTQAVGLLFSLRTQFDLMHPGVTPSGQLRVFEILNRRPALQVRLAVLVSQAHSGQYVYRRASARTPRLPNLAAKMFFDLDTALNWLKQVNTPAIEDDELSQ